MIKTKNINVPATLIHKMDEKKYVIDGLLLSINESNLTCKMSFKNGKIIEDNIPMANIFINEGILDTIKNAGQKIGRGISQTISYVVHKVEGFLVPEHCELEDVQSAPINLMIRQAQDPDPICPIYATPALASDLKNLGVPVQTSKTPLSDISYQEDINSINNYWQNVMQEYSENEDETIEESVQHVLERMYGKQHLNEAEVYTNPVQSLASVTKGGLGFTNVSTEELKFLILQNITSQIQNFLPGGKRKNKEDKVRPLMVFGAPGIGKTSILGSVDKYLEEKQGNRFYVQAINTAEINKDDMSVPVIKKRKFAFFGNKQTIKDTPIDSNETDDKTLDLIIDPTRIPLYEPSKDPKTLQEQDDFYNNCRYLSGNEDNQENFIGGILFFDEYTRIGRGVQSIFNNLLLERTYGNKVLPSNWAIIGAANRPQEMSENSQRTIEWESSFTQRWDIVNFVPTKKEWLQWATSTNVKTGKPYVDPIITNFIQIAPDGVWYSTLDFGSFNNIGDKNSTVKIDTNSDDSDYDQYLEDHNLKTMFSTVSPRTWVEISRQLVETRMSLLGENLTDEYFKNLNKQFIENNKLKGSPLFLTQDLKNMISPSLATNKKDQLKFKIQYLINKNTEFINAYGRDKTKDVYETLPDGTRKLVYQSTLNQDFEDSYDFAKDMNSSYKILDKNGNNINQLLNVIDDLKSLEQKIDKKNIDIAEKEFSGILNVGLTPVVNNLMVGYTQILIDRASGTNSSAKSIQSENFERQSLYLRTFNIKDCASLWENGDFASTKYKKDDEVDIKSGKVPDSMIWKTATGYFPNVIKTILDNYPGNPNAEFFNDGSEYKVELEDLEPYTTDKAIPAVQKWITQNEKKFSFKYQGLDLNAFLYPQVLNLVKSTREYGSDAEYTKFTNLSYFFIHDNEYLTKLLNLLSWSLKEFVKIGNGFDSFVDDMINHTQPYQKIFNIQFKFFDNGVEITPASKPDNYKMLMKLFIAANIVKPAQSSDSGDPYLSRAAKPIFLLQAFAQLKRSFLFKKLS